MHRTICLAVLSVALIAAAANSPVEAGSVASPMDANCTGQVTFFQCDSKCSSAYGGGDFTLRYACDDGCDYRCNDNDDDDDQDDEGRLEAQGKRQLRHHSPYCITLELCQHRCQKSEDSQHMQACQAGCGYRCA